MGAWSTASFGNDEALDWFGELGSSNEPLDFIRQTISTGTNEGVVAAAEILALLHGKPGVDVHPDVVAWCQGKTAPDADLLQAANKALQEILDDPEADVHDAWAELGEDDEDYMAWLANLRDIQARLLSSCS